MRSPWVTRGYLPYVQSAYVLQQCWYPRRWQSSRRMAREREDQIAQAVAEPGFKRPKAIPSLTGSQDEDGFVEFKNSVLAMLALLGDKDASSATDRDWFRGNRPCHSRSNHLSSVGRRARQHRQGTKARQLSLARIPDRASAVRCVLQSGPAVWGASPPVSWRAWRAVIRQPLGVRAAGGHARPAASGGIGPSPTPSGWPAGPQPGFGSSVCAQTQAHPDSGMPLLQAMASECPFFRRFSRIWTWSWPRAT